MIGMKGKKLLLLAGIMAIITAVSTLITNGASAPKTYNDEKITIVTSFYPMYIATLNLTEGIDGVEVENLMSQQVGCPHDYTLTTADMKRLEQANLLVINGAGMESYIEEVAASYKELTIIDSSENISLLEGEEHHHEEDEHAGEVTDEHAGEVTDEHADEDDHEHVDDEEHAEEDDHDHGAFNGHIWMDPSRYMLQLENLAKGLIAKDPSHEAEYEANLQAYKKRINQVWKQYEELGTSEEHQVVIFHDAMEYLMNRLGIEVPYSIDIDGETSLSAGEIAEVIEEVKAHNIKVLFIEEQFDANIANRIAEETNAKVYVLDTMVSGDMERDAYINSLTSNLAVIKEALYQ